MIDVFIINRSPLTRSLIAGVLEKEPDMRVVGAATYTEGALELIRANHRDVVLISADLPNDGALRLTQAIKKEALARTLIMELPEVQADIFRFIEAGAAGFVFRDDSVTELQQNIRAVHRGQALISPRLAAALVSRVCQLAALRPVEKQIHITPDLSPREVEVLSLIGDGLSNREIASRLVIELGTVKAHVHKILQKLDVESRLDAAAYWNGYAEYEAAEEYRL